MRPGRAAVKRIRSAGAVRRPGSIAASAERKAAGATCPASSFPELQIVGLTSTPRNAPIARHAGVNAIVAKPATADGLSGAVHTVLPYCTARGR